MPVHLNASSQPLRPRPIRVASAAARPVAASWLATRQAPASTLGEGLKRLEDLAARLDATGDRRAVFAATYAIQIRAFMVDVNRPGRYANPEWMSRMTLDFLQRYFDAFAAYERGDHAAVPAAWKVAFDRATAANGPVMTDLLLAMNAHINHDLPLSLAATGAKAAVRTDYLRFNEVLAAHVDAVQAVIAERYMVPARGESLAAIGDRWLGSVDEGVAGLLIRRWRDAAWINGQAIAQHGPAAYPAVQRRAGWRTTAIGAGSDLLPGFLARRGLL